MDSALFPQLTAADLIRAIVRRLPFTLLMVVAILLVTAVTETMTEPITPENLNRWGFGLDDLRAGRLYQLLLTPFQAYRPYMVLTITASLLLFLGTCEYVLGTRRALIAFWTTHVVGYLGAFLLLWLLAAAGVGWAERTSRVPDVGASAAAFGAAGVVIPFLPSLYRRTAFTALAAYLLAYLVVDRRVWDVEHMLAFPAGVLLGIGFLRTRGDPWPSLLLWPRLDRRQRPAVVAWAVGVMGAVNILSAFVSPRQRGLVWIEEQLPVELADTSRNLTLVAGFALLLLAFGLARGRQQAWLFSVAILAVSTVLHLTKGADLPEAVLSAGVTLGLIVWRDAFIARADVPVLRQAYGVLLLLALLIPMYGMIGFFVLRSQYDEVYTLRAALEETGARLLFLNADQYTPLTHRARWFLDSIPVLGWSGVLYALVAVMRGAFAPTRTASDVEQAQGLLTRYGRSGTSYMTLWQGNSVFFGPGAGRAYIGYRVAAGTALALGDPIGPDAALAPTVTAFERFCREHGWEHGFYAATADRLPMYERLGYQVVKIGEEALVPLPGLELKGKGWQDVRTAINRAARDGITFCLYEGGTAPAPVRDQLFAITAEWLREKDLPEMGFTLGRTEDVDDPNVYVAVAVDETGRVQGFVDWLPMYAAHGWVIDLMRRRADAFSGVMEFLIGSSLLAFKERGYQVASLAAAPLADQDRGPGATPLQKALGFVYERFDAFYHFQSLFNFKRKFQPSWEGVYLVYRAHTELPQIALAILRAHMPDLGPRLIGSLIGSAVTERLLKSQPDDMPPCVVLPAPVDDAH